MLYYANNCRVHHIIQLIFYVLQVGPNMVVSGSENIAQQLASLELIFLLWMFAFSLLVQQHKSHAEAANEAPQ